MSTVIGIDEAGRGPVLGPLVVGMVVWDRSRDLPGNLILRDSKRMTRAQREETVEYLRSHVNHRLLCIPAWVLDRPNTTLTQIQARVIGEGLEKSPPAPVLCDALGNGSRASRWIRNRHPGRNLRFEPGADDTYPAVSAASVLAKQTRDRALEHLCEKWGELGSGYPSDPVTRQWLKEWAQTGRDWPPFVRTRWSTLDPYRAGTNGEDEPRPPGFE